MMSNIAYNGETIGNRTCIIQWQQKPVYDTLDLTAKAPGTFGDDFKLGIVFVSSIEVRTRLS